MEKLKLEKLLNACTKGELKIRSLVISMIKDLLWDIALLMKL